MLLCERFTWLNTAWPHSEAPARPVAEHTETGVQVQEVEGRCFSSSSNHSLTCQKNFVISQSNILWREMYSFWEDNTSHLQCTPIKHLFTSFSPTFFSPKGEQFKKFYRCAQDFIDVQSHQISLQITVNRGLTEETSLPAHSYFAPPVLATARQETPEFSFWPTKPFLQPTCSYTRHPDPLLRALWAFPPSLFLNCILSWQF